MICKKKGPCGRLNKKQASRSHTGHLLFEMNLVEQESGTGRLYKVTANTRTIPQCTAVCTLKLKALLLGDEYNFKFQHIE